MESMFNPELISLARKSRGKTQSALASDIGVPIATLSRYEGGSRVVSEQLMKSIAGVLDYPVGFFLQRPSRYEWSGEDPIYHRKRQSAPANALNRAYALAEVRRLEAAKLLDEYPLETTIPSHSSEIFDPATAARELRASWGIPSGPVFNMTRVIERGGGLVFSHDFGTPHIDGFSTRSYGIPAAAPIIHLNRDLPSDRWRWTLAHELGHIVLHFGTPALPEEVERQANAFASEFLAPAREIGPMLVNLDLHSLAGLKIEWKISMQTIIMRAAELGHITAKQKQNMFIRLTKVGYRNREPESLAPPLEPPRLPFQMARYYLTTLGYRREDLLDYLAVNETDFQKYYHDPDDYSW